MNDKDSALYQIVDIVLSCCSSETSMLTRGKIWIYMCATHKYKE